MIIKIMKMPMSIEVNASFRLSEVGLIRKAIPIIIRTIPASFD